MPDKNKLTAEQLAAKLESIARKLRESNLTPEELAKAAGGHSLPDYVLKDIASHGDIDVGAVRCEKVSGDITSLCEGSCHLLSTDSPDEQ